MKKVYIYDKESGKMIERRPANELPSFHIKSEEGVSLGEGYLMDVMNAEIVNAVGVRLPKRELPHTHGELTQEQRRENLTRVLELADKHAETMDRRDCIRVQEKIEYIRQKHFEG